MYKRFISDESEIEPRKLNSLDKFLMYDKTFKGKVTAEENLQILYVRYKRDRLDEEITFIFGEDGKNDDGSEKDIMLGEYVGKINKRVLKEQAIKTLNTSKALRRNLVHFLTLILFLCIKL